ncbi:MAG TPA: rRNA maturation RNase YbeY [Pseudogracilibacillus sp.]|nr:rRNA maturation RNase YbeY [Pseudogracilibacillus sp.]
MHIDIQDETNFVTKPLQELVYKVLQTTAKKEQVPEDSELSVVFVTNETIQRLNKDYRNKNEVTDVLSFPLYSQDEIKKSIKDTPIALGDIVISYNQAKEQAETYGHSLEREVCFLAVHGLLHLLGYTHDTEEEEREMFLLQEQVLKEFQLERS